MADAPMDDYRLNVELNQTLLEEELKGIVQLAQGAGAQAWDEITALPPGKQKTAIRNALKHITEEHGASAMLAAQDNMEAHVGLWARERGSHDGLPTQIEQSSPLGGRKLDGYADDVYKRLIEDPGAAEDAFSRLITGTVMNRARRVVDNTCKRSQLRFYRVPERRACWFCLMLASRGPVYYSEYTAGKGNRYHAHCRCTVRAALPGEKLHPVVEQLHKYHNRGNKYMWKAWADNGELDARIAFFGYKVHKGRLPVGAWPGGIPKREWGVRAYKDLASVPRVKDTSFAANVGDINPHYGKVTQWPEVWGDKRPYDINCIRCSAALIMRRKGYKLQAGAGMYVAPFRALQGDVGHMLSCFHDENGKPVFYAAGRTKKGNNSNKETMKLVRGMPVGSYGVLLNEWDLTPGIGHIWCWEIDEKEGLIFWDGQTGEKRDIYKTLYDTKLTSLRYARLDNVTPTDDILNVISIPEPERKKIRK